MLIKRGNYLKKGDFQSAYKVESAITDEKNKNFELITTPNNFFYTFKSQKAFNTFIKDPYLKIFENRQTKAWKADNPSNIIYENLSISEPKKVFC